MEFSDQKVDFRFCLIVFLFTNKLIAFNFLLQYIAFYSPLSDWVSEPIPGNCFLEVAKLSRELATNRGGTGMV